MLAVGPTSVDTINASCWSYTTYYSDHLVLYVNQLIYACIICLLYMYVLFLAAVQTVWESKEYYLIVNKTD